MAGSNTSRTEPPTFNELILRSQLWDADFTELDPVPLDRFELSEDSLIFGNNSALLDQDARNRLFKMFGAPDGYLSRRSIDVQIVALRDHFRQEEVGRDPKLVLRNGRLFTIRRDNLVELAHSEVLSAVAESLGAHADGLIASRIEYSDGRLALDLVSPSKAIEVRRGDIVRAGLHIEHSRYSDQATQIYSFVYRLVCENGMTRRECSADGIVRIRKLPMSHPRGRELLLDQIRRLTDRTGESWSRSFLNCAARAKGAPKSRSSCGSGCSARASRRAPRLPIGPGAFPPSWTGCLPRGATPGPMTHTTAR